MTVGRPSRWPWVALAAFVAIAMGGLTLVVVNGESVAEQIPFVVAFSMFGFVGALILSRDPRNRIGALLLYGSCTTAIGFLAGETVTYLFERGTTDGVGIVTLGLISDLGWVVGILPVLFLLPLLFPDGHVPSPRWRPLSWAIVAFLLLLAAALVFGNDVLTGSSDDVQIPNPLYVSALANVEISDAVINAALLLLLGASFASIVVRFRRSRGVERQQIKWVALAILLLVVSLVLSTILLALGIESPLIDTLITAPAFLALPISIGVAVLQFHLYDLDVVVKKALVAGTLALVVIVVYGVLVGLYGLVAAEGRSSGWVFVAALALGLAFRPVARFARRLADRVVYGRRATPYEVLTEFSERVGDAYATDDVLERMARLLGEGTGADRVAIWLHVGSGLRRAASWPAGSTVDDSIPLFAIARPDTFEVRHQGELLGAITATMPANDPMNPAKERVIHDLTSQAGLVLRNVRLVEDLRASQRRLVTARDEERRRIERNIHDGAQQQLVALSVQTRLVRGLNERDPAKADAMLSTIESQLQTALEDLRDLARGIYPPLLADKGLGAALEAQARRSAVPVTVETNGVGRFPQEVEAAVYFACLEALQNVAKYADARSVRLTLAQVNDDLTFEVADDGRGFDPERTGYGTGLQGIADRFAALEGAARVESRPGDGTTVSGHVPVPARPDAPDPVPAGPSTAARRAEARTP
jgi:signal transduction histidine kinase